jgi:hypothetical protein
MVEKICGISPALFIKLRMRWSLLPVRQECRDLLCARLTQHSKGVQTSFAPRRSCNYCSEYRSPGWRYPSAWSRINSRLDRHSNTLRHMPGYLRHAARRWQRSDAGRLPGPSHEANRSLA